MGVLAQPKNGDEQFWNIEILCSQWEGSACPQSALIFFLLSFGVAGEGDFFPFFFVSFKFPMSSHQVLNMFPMCSPKLFPIAPRLNPICFGQSPPLLTYIARPKGMVLYCSIESSDLGNLPSFFFFVLWANQTGSFAKKKIWTCEAPPINWYETEYGEDFVQNIWDYNKVLLETPLGNTLGT